MTGNEQAEVVLYTGSYRHGIDEKRRVQIPAKWRPKRGSCSFSVIVWPKYQVGPCLRVLPWDKMIELLQKLNGLPDSDANKTVLKRVIGSSSEQVVLDKAGRICLPDSMVSQVGIANEVVLVGCMDKFEIWPPERYEKIKLIDSEHLPQAFALLE